MAHRARSDEVRNGPSSELRRARTAAGMILRNIISLSNYDIIEMPGILRAKKQEHWSRRDANAYFEWLMSVKPSRVAQLIDIAGAARGGSWTDVSLSVSEVIRTSLDNLGEINVDGTLRANGLGMIAGFDAALVVGDQLVATIPGVSWSIVRTRVKHFISANLTAVHRDSIVAFEPFLEGRMLLTLANRKRASDGYDFVNEKFESWYERLKAV